MPLLPAPSHDPDGLAYPAPWHLDRSQPAPWFRLEHRGFESAEALTVSLLGSGRLIAACPGRLIPGDRLRFAIRGADPADDSTLIVKWRTPGGDAYLWRATF